MQRWEFVSSWLEAQTCGYSMPIGTVSSPPAGTAILSCHHNLAPKELTVWRGWIIFSIQLEFQANSLFVVFGGVAPG